MTDLAYDTESRNMNGDMPKQNVGQDRIDKELDDHCAWSVGVTTVSEVPDPIDGSSANANSNTNRKSHTQTPTSATPGMSPSPFQRGLQLAGTFDPTENSRNGKTSGRGVRLGMEVKEGGHSDFASPSSSPDHTNYIGANATVNDNVNIGPPSAYNPYNSFFEAQLSDEAQVRAQPTLAACCNTLGFDVAEIWLRTSSKTHSLVASYLRPTALDETQREELTNLYYGVDASSRTHKLSPSLCKKVKTVNDVFWVPDDVADTDTAERALSLALYQVQTAVAIPVTHAASNTNLTIIFLCTRKAKKTNVAIEFLVHMSLATAIAAVQPLHYTTTSPRLPFQSDIHKVPNTMHSPYNLGMIGSSDRDFRRLSTIGDGSSEGVDMTLGTHDLLSQSDHPTAITAFARDPHRPNTADGFERHHSHQFNSSPHRRTSGRPYYNNQSPTYLNQSSTSTAVTTPSPTIPEVDLHISPDQILNREYLTDGTNNWIHTGLYKKQPIVIKELKPECEDAVRCIHEIEKELEINAKLLHPNICKFMGAGLTQKGTNFLVFERLDGGTLTQTFGYERRIRDRRKRFGFGKKKMPAAEALKCALSIAEAMDYLHAKAVPGCMVLHRDLKPDNIGFAMNGTVKIIDFGLSTVVENASPDSDEVFDLSGETGSLRYMAPEVADAHPYNHKADVYSFGMILWELTTYEKPFANMDRKMFYERVVHGNERPPISRKIPDQWAKLITQCWSYNYLDRPVFSTIVETLRELIENESRKAPKQSRISKFLLRDNSSKEFPKQQSDRRVVQDRQSAWF